jgi:hypothetical protein
MAKNLLAVSKAQGKQESRRFFFRGMAMSLAMAALPAIAAVAAQPVHVRAKLTQHEIDLIANMAESGMSYLEIATRFA